MNIVTRRDFLKTTATGSLALGLGGALAACGASASPTQSGSSGAVTPRRGGVLRAGLTGGSSSDTLDALNLLNSVDSARLANLYEPLVGYNPDASLKMLLAQEMTPNQDATVWTIRLRSGVTFHNGKDLTADDVIYTFQRILDPKTPASGASSLTLLDIAGMKKLDRLTVRIPCKAPFVSFMQVMPAYYFNIVPVGYDLKNPVGTGPFELSSFTPGQQSVFKRNPDYWQTGLPYLDELVISDFSDETSQVNALLGGQVDVVNLLSADVIGEMTGAGKRTVISEGGGWTPFTMRVDSAPFNDVRVRQAMRLIVDRKQMLDLLFGGRGTIGNDVFGIWAPEYDKQLPQRQQDIEQAKFLLKAAGQEGLTVQLVTSDIAQGTVNAAQVFAQQAKSAGVTVNLQKVTVTDFYGTNYLKWPFAQDYWYFAYYLPQVAQGNLLDSPFNETHWGNAQYNKLYGAALSTVDEAKRFEIIHEMQTIDYNEGGYIIPYFPPVIDGCSANVQGLTPSKVGLSLNGYQFKDLWLA